ncbi:MAG: dienelactone hydrolase family protein [Gammaproteobacteria bacterium]|nr:dienelactone hydrolase family protein [Gammaproteobacteria bacterium]
MGTQRQLHAEDGFTLGAYEAMPSGDPTGAVVIIQEIFGVNDHIREVVNGYADDGYAVIAPQIFDRAQRDVELGYEGDDMSSGIKLAFQETDRAKTLIDLQAAVEEIGKWGKVAVIGYCYGGLLTWLAACQLRGVACAVAFYGGGIAAEKDQTARCPTMMHFGELDKAIPMTDVDAIRTAQPDVDVHTYAADHGFNCNHRASYNAAAAALARERTVAFLREHLN